MDNFINYGVVSHFSILNSLMSPRDIFLKVKELQQPAVAVADIGSMANHFDMYKLCKNTDIKFIPGIKLHFTNDVNNREEKPRYITLYAKNHIGYQNLLLLNRKGFDKSFLVSKRNTPIIDWKLLEKYRDGLIATTSCGNGVISQLLNTKKFDEAEEDLKKLIYIFNENLAIELQTNNSIRGKTFYTEPVNQFFTNTHLIRLAKKYSIKMLPSSNAQYMCANDAKTHDTLLAVAAMQPVYSNFRTKFNCSDLFLKTRKETETFFARGNSEEFAKELCDNALYFANICEQPDYIDPKYSNKNGKELPTFPCKDENDYQEFLEWSKNHKYDNKEDELYLRFKCEQILPSKIPAGKEKEYRDRLEKELDVFYHCGSASYMLVVWDYVRYAWEIGATLSAGRGSVGCSLIGYILNIHFADPIKYNLPFERFYSKQRTSFADIDIDISKSKRDTVIQYVINKYGTDNVAQISNYIFVTPKVYVRDLSRSCEFGGSREKAVEIGTNIADIIPKRNSDEKEIRTYKDIITYSPLFNEFIKKYPELNIHSQICGQPRSLGLHAAGLVIGSRSLSSIVPTRLDKDGSVAIQADKDRTEELGLVKMDILGLETIDIIQESNRLIKLSGKEVPKIEYEEYDQKTYDLISDGNTFCVFQFGISPGTIDLCKKIKPKCMEDLAVITTIARPASRAIREDYINARDSGKEAKLLHPSLQNALKDTLGFPLYDESLLLLARDVSNWDLGEADKLRKLTKMKGSNPSKAEQWRQDFINGAIKNNIKADDAINIWDQVILPYSRYSFNKSHAIVYSMLSFHTAYLKAHFPVEFLLANLVFEINSSSPVAEENARRIKQELRNNKIKIIPPNINTSDLTYRIEKDGSLSTGLKALKFVTDDAVKEIIAKRPFTSLFDFMTKVNSSVRSNTIQALAASGCLDEFGLSRKQIFLYISDYRKRLQAWIKKHDPLKEVFDYPFPKETNWSLSEMYALEKTYLGESFICKPKDAYQRFFSDGTNTTVQQIKKMGDRDNIDMFKCVIKSVFSFKVKKETSKLLGQSMCRVTVEDANGDQIAITIFPKQWKAVNQRMKELCKNKYAFDADLAISIVGSANIYEGETNIILDQLINISPPPAVPTDLKHRKITVRKTSSKKDIENIDINDTKTFIDEIEDELFEEGLLDEEEEQANEYEEIF